jgi:ribosomal protein S18 acetylase RimI-like enzyme
VEAVRLQSYLRGVAARGRRRVQVEGFDAFFHPRTDNRHLNFAMPRPDEPRAVAEMVDAFEAAERMPRVEWVQEAAPDLEGVLAEAGFTEELRTPVMTSTAPGALEPLPGLAFEAVTAHAEPDLIRTFLTTQREPFGAEADAVTDADVDGFTMGGGALLARLEGEPAAAGLYTEPAEGLAELAGIGVLDHFQRRGIGARLTAELARHAFARGDVEVAFLTPGGEATGRVYERAGFRATLTALYWNRG